MAKKTTKKSKYNREEKRMMKLQTIFILIIAAIYLVACSENSKKTTITKFKVGDCVSKDEFVETTDDNYKIVKFGADAVLLKGDHVTYPLYPMYYEHVNTFHKIPCGDFQ